VLALVCQHPLEHAPTAVQHGLRHARLRQCGAAHIADESKQSGVVPVEHITQSILVLRGHRVLLDTELAALYGVSTKRFNEQVRRNRERFPADFMFQLTDEELVALRSQIATLKGGRGQHRKYLPYAFTEHGAIMAATILNSSRAVEMSVYVVRAFVKLRELLSSNRELARRFAQLETRLDKKLTEHDQQIAAILSAIRQLMHPPAPKKRGIGFTADIEDKK
jgi:phage regulator Rha-like protein